MSPPCLVGRLGCRSQGSDLEQYERWARACFGGFAGGAVADGRREASRSRARWPVRRATEPRTNRSFLTCIGWNALVWRYEREV